MSAMTHAAEPTIFSKQSLDRPSMIFLMNTSTMTGRTQIQPTEQSPPPPPTPPEDDNAVVFLENDNVGITIGETHRSRRKECR